jgi:hypothetical protein
MLLERTEYVVIATLQPAITLEWVSTNSDTFGTSAVFRWRTRDISTGHIVIQILRGGTVVYTFPNRTPSSDWVEETWVRVPPRGNFTIFAYWSNDPTVNASLTGSIVANPTLSAVWYVSNAPAGTDITVERGTPVFARLLVHGSDQSLLWNEGNFSTPYDPPSPPGYWNNYTLDIPVSTTILGTYNFAATLEGITRNLRMVVTAITSTAQVEVEWSGGNVFQYGQLAQARWRTQGTDASEQVELFYIHNGTRHVLGTVAPSTSWQPFSWNVVPPRGSLVMGAKLLVADREAVVVGSIAPDVEFKVDLISPSSFYLSNPNGRFSFNITVNQSEHPIRVYRNNQLIHTFTPTGAWWDNANINWDNRPSATGVYTYRFVLENENREFSFTTQVLGDRSDTDDPGDVPPPSVEIEWVGANAAVFGDYLYYRVRVRDSAAPAQVYYVRGSTQLLLQTVPNDGNWHTYPFRVRPPRGTFELYARIDAYNLLRIIQGTAQAQPRLRVEPQFPVYLPENTPFRPEFLISVHGSDRDVFIYEDGAFIDRLRPPEDGYWYNNDREWFYIDRVGTVEKPIIYEFYLENERDANNQPIMARVIVNFYRERQSDAMLLENTEFVALSVTEEPPPPSADNYVRLFFVHKLYVRAIYFHVMGHSAAASYHQRTGASFLIGDTRKMPARRYLVIETGGSRV